MNGVRIIVDQDSVKVEATDGRTLGVVTCPNDPSPEYMSGLVSLVSVAAAPAHSAIISREVWEEAFESVPDQQARDSLRVLGCSMASAPTAKLPDSDKKYSEGHPVSVVFGQMDGERSLRIEARGIDGRYPDTHAILSTLSRTGSKPIATICFDAAILQRLLSVAEQFADENRKVKLTIFSADTPMFVESRNGQQKFVGAVMPLM
jgi:hypothetical protein